MRSTLSALVILTLLSAPALGDAQAPRRVAIIMGGAAHFSRNEFTEDLAQKAETLHARGWETKVFFDSDAYKEDWKEFPASTRPQVPGALDHQFSFENYEKTIDDLIKKGIGKDDQVYINLEAHGASYFGAHTTIWKETAGQSPHGAIVTELFNMRRTSTLADKIENLLKKGVRVQFDIFSCYDGAALTAYMDLLKKYPDQLCMTTSASSDRESILDGRHPSMFPKSTQENGSALDGFKNLQNPTAQISAIPEWMKIFEKSPSLESRNDDECAFCKAVQEDPLATLLDSKTRKLVESAQAISSKTKSKIQKLEEACSAQTQLQLAQELSDKVEKLNQNYNHKSISITRNDAPILFKKGQSGVWFGPYEELVRNEDQEVWQVDVTITQLAQHLHWPNNYRRDQQQKAELKRLIAQQDSEFQKDFAQYEKELEKINMEIEPKTCNRKTLNTELIAARKSHLEAAIKNPKSPLQAKLIQACANFKY